MVPKLRAGSFYGETAHRRVVDGATFAESVYRREVDQLSELAEQLKGAPEPLDALRRWMKANVELVATKKGMISALALAVQTSSDLYAHSFDRLSKAIGSLLDRAVTAGQIRADLGPDELLRALIGMCYLHDQPGWQSTVLRLMDVFIDGLRVKPDGGGKARKSPRKKTAKAAKRRYDFSPSQKTSASRNS